MIRTAIFLLVLAIGLAGCATPPAGPITRPDHPPVPIVRPLPAYPFEMKQASVTGDVTVEYTINTDGLVVDAKIISSTNSAFEAPALDAILHSKFHPATKEGKPVNLKVQQTLYFSLSDGAPAKN